MTWGSGRVFGAAEAEHDEAEARGVVDAVRASEAGAVVVEGAGADRLFTFGGDGVRSREALFVLRAQLVLGREDFLAGCRYPFARRGAPIGVRVVVVLHPFPDVAGE